MKKLWVYIFSIFFLGFVSICYSQAILSPTTTTLACYSPVNPKARLSPKGKFFLYQALSNGLAVKPDNNIAWACLNEAAQEKWADAQLELGILFNATSSPTGFNAIDRLPKKERIKFAYAWCKTAAQFKTSISDVANLWVQSFAKNSFKDSAEKNAAEALAKIYITQYSG